MATRPSLLHQILWLLWDIVSTVVSSSFYSCILAFRAVFSRQSSSSYYHPTITAAGEKLGAISLYEGIVWHERKCPLTHKFTYHVRYALVNLDCAPCWFKSTAARHHMGATEARRFAGTTGPVYLLTVPTSVGYEQNPLSVYYCFDDDETCLSRCIAEVTNTPWSERVIFMFDAKGDCVAKPLHVSPFMDMSGSWRMKASVPGRELSITIVVQHPELGNYFVASLSAKHVDCALSNPEGFFWLMPHKTALGIYWQAFLIWCKGIKFHQHPKYIDGDAYRDRAIQCSRGLPQNWQEGRGAEVTNANFQCPCPLMSNVSTNSKSQDRQHYTWHEANWPWT